jgi:hypothetical protein
MTIGAWGAFIGISAAIISIAALIAYAADCGTGGKVATAVICTVLVIWTFVCCHWWVNNTAAGQRARKTQESNLGGGLYRIVTVYSYDGTPIKSWEGQFDVTENDQETWFDYDGKRVIIQGGIIINEETE